MIDDETGALPALSLLKYWQPHCADRPLTDTTVCLYIYGEETEQPYRHEKICNLNVQQLITPDALQKAITLRITDQGDRTAEDSFFPRWNSLAILKEVALLGRPRIKR